MSKKIHSVNILEKAQLASDIYAITVERPQVIETLNSCQFFNLAVDGVELPLLKRPISLSSWTDKTLTFVIKKIGKGTEALCNAAVGQTLLMVGALGNGIDETIINEDRPWILVGGGIGTAPLVGTAMLLKEKGKINHAVMGYLNETYLVNDYENLSTTVTVATIEETSNAYHGNAIEALLSNTNLSTKLNQYNIAVCGPDKMLEAAKNQLLDRCHTLYLVTEEKMACGMGACLVCAKKVTREDGLASMVRTCIEGPVFKAEEVIFE